MASGQGHGGMSLSMKFIRFLIVLFNLAFVSVGILFCCVGVYVVRDPQLQQLQLLLNPNLTSEYSQSLSYIKVFAIAIIVIGAVLLAIGFLGCCGAIKGFRFLHVLYAIVIGLVIVAEVAIVVSFVAYQQKVRPQLIAKLQYSIKANYTGPPLNNSTVVNPISLAWDFTQFNLQCCGAVSSNDFNGAISWNTTDPYQPGSQLTVPFTCCPTGITPSWSQLPTNFSSADQCARTGQGAYTQGCYDRIVSNISAYRKNVIIGLVVVGTVEVLAFIFSISLYCRKADYATL